MAIEPISSAMTYQAQQTPAAKPTAKTETVDTEVALSESTVSFDPTTVKVTESQESNSKGQDNNQGKPENNTQAVLDSAQATSDRIKKAVEEINKKMNNAEAVFGIHEETNHVTIKLVDKDTKEVIKELPAEKTLDMIARVWEMAGILVDEKR